MDRLISPPPGYFTRCLREEYYLICDRNQCAAMVLSQHEYWHGLNLMQRRKAQYRNEVARRGAQTPTQDTSLWSPMSHADMKAQLLDNYGERAIADAYKLLIARGYLKVRSNPRQSWDRKPQYLFAVEEVQTAVDALPARAVDEIDEESVPSGGSPQSVGGASAETAESTPQNCGEDAAILQGRVRNFAGSSPQNGADSGKNLSENTQRISQRAALPPRNGSASLSEKERSERGRNAGNTSIHIRPGTGQSGLLDLCRIHGYEAVLEKLRQTHRVAQEQRQLQHHVQKQAETILWLEGEAVKGDRV